MSRYRKIEVRTWSDEKFRALSGIPPSGQGLWFFLLTGPHTTAIPGLFRAGRAAMAEELGWEQEAFDEAFAEVSGQGMAKADFKAKLVWLPKAIQHNKPESPNVVRGWRVELDLLPECDLKREALAAIREALEAVGPSYVEAFDEVFGKAAKPVKSEGAKPSPKPSRKAMPNQEQQQEQEQEQQQEQDTSGEGGKPPPAAPAPAPASAKAKTPAEQEKAELWRDMKAVLVEQTTCADTKAAGELLGGLAAKYGKDVFHEALRATRAGAPGNAHTYLVALCETAAGKRVPLGRSAPMTDEQRQAANAAETQKAKDLYRKRYGGGDVIDAEATVIEQEALEGPTA